MLSRLVAAAGLAAFAQAVLMQAALAQAVPAQRPPPLPPAAPQATPQATSPLPPLPPRRPAEAPQQNAAPEAPSQPAPAAPQASSPSQQAPPSPSAPAAAETAAAPAATPAETCLAGLKAAGFEVEAAETPQASNPLCRIEAPVRLKAVPVPTRHETSIRLTEQPILACRFAGPFGRWIGDLVAPVVAGIKGVALKAVRTGPGFECRNRNRSATGKLSAHAEGLAIDIAAFELADGSAIRVEQAVGSPQDPALAAVRTGGCGWFTTILGPGSDAAHDDHLHVDILLHGSSDRYRICQ